MNVVDRPYEPGFWWHREGNNGTWNVVEVWQTRSGWGYGDPTWNPMELDNASGPDDEWVGPLASPDKFPTTPEEVKLGELNRLAEENKRLRFMVENGLGPEDMEQDI